MPSNTAEHIVNKHNPMTIGSARLSIGQDATGATLMRHI